MSTSIIFDSKTSEGKTVLDQMSVDKLFVRFVGKNSPLHDELTLQREIAPGLRLAPSVMLPEGDSVRGAAALSPRVMEHLSLDEDTVFARAIENSAKLLPPVIMPLHEMLGAPSLGPNGPIAVTNREGFLGASVLVYPGVIEELTERCGGAFYILPSSIHEVLALPMSSEFDVADLTNMVRSINAGMLDSSDILSDSVYRYDPDTNTFEEVM